MFRAASLNFVRLRALCAALFLLTAAIAAPTAIAAQSVDECGMSCCVKDGYCCCSPHHARVKGQISDERPRLSQPELARSCPESCATTARVSNLILRNHLSTAAVLIWSEQLTAISFEHSVPVGDQLDGGTSSPRAAPLFLLPWRIHSCRVVTSLITFARLLHTQRSF